MPPKVHGANKKDESKQLYAWLSAQTNGLLIVLSVQKSTSSERVQLKVSCFIIFYFTEGFNEATQ